MTFITTRFPISRARLWMEAGRRHNLRPSRLKCEKFRDRVAQVRADLRPQTMAHYRTTESQSYALKRFLLVSAIMSEHHQRHYTQPRVRARVYTRIRTHLLSRIADQRHTQRIISPRSSSRSKRSFGPSELRFA